MLAHVLLCLRANGSQVNLLLQLLPEPSQYGVIENIVTEMLDRIIICAARFEALNLRGILHHELTQFTNIVLALGIKAIFLAITFAGMATMWMAVFADMGVSLLVVFNGLRLLRK